VSSATSLVDCVAVVTGATRGIGREVALSLARHGCHVVVVGRTARNSPGDPLPGSIEDTVELVAEYGVSVLGVQADLRDERQTGSIVEQTLERFGRCDILINNAAYTSNGSMFSVPWHRWGAAFRVQVVAPLQLCQGFVPGMRERGRGVVLNVSSGAAVKSAPGLSLYSTSKQAMERWSSFMHHELVGAGVDVNVLRIDRLVATEGWRHVVETQGMDIATGGSPDAVAVTSASVADVACWLVAREPGWSGHTVGFAEVAALGGPSVVDLGSS